MSVDHRTEVEQVLMSLVREFKSVSKNNNYRTNVVTALSPQWSWRRLDMIKAWSETPAIFVWALAIGMAKTGHRIGSRRRSIEVAVVGLLRGDEGIDEAVYSLEDDINRVMIENQNRSIIGSVVPNTFGVLTSDGGGMMASFDIDRPANSSGIGLIRARYRVEIKTTIPAQ